MNDPLELLLRDHVRLLREAAAQAKRDGAGGDAFEQGRWTGLYEAVSLLQQQARAFGIPKARIGMENFDADRDMI